MSHIGIKCLGAGRTQEYRAQYQKTGKAMPEQITEAIAWIERHEHTGMAEDTAKPEQADGHKPECHNRAEQLANSLAALRLQGEQADQDHRGHRNDVGRDLRRRYF